MAIKALNLATIHRHISEHDDDKDPKTATVFELGVLSSRDVGRVRDTVTSVTISTAEGGSDDVLTNIEKSKMNFEALRRGLKGWSNFIGPDGKPVPFETEKCTVDGKKREVVKDALLDLIPLVVVEELAGIIISDNQTSEDDLKN